MLDGLKICICVAGYSGTQGEGGGGKTEGAAGVLSGPRERARAGEGGGDILHYLDVIVIPTSYLCNL